MKFEVLNQSHLKRNIIIGIIAILIISAVVLNFTRAKYRVTESIPLVNGTINYSLADLNIVAITVDGESVDNIPEGNYELTEKSYCTVNGETDSSISLSYDSSTQTLQVIPFTTKGTKCYLYFGEQLCIGEACNTILANKTISNERSGTVMSIFTSDTTGTVYRVVDDDGDSYVFAGAPTDNWVSFAGFYWRIIRINGDGSIRLIYNGTSTETTGSGTMISSSQAFNSSYNDNAYVGYMYGSTGASSYASTHTNTNNSSIKTVVDNWYRDNLLQYAQYISTEAGFCGDRRIATSSENWWLSDTKLGYGTNATAYGSFGRLYLNFAWRTDQHPMLQCSQSNDLYTVSGSSKGNRALTYPIGLITADEVVLAGGFGGASNSNYYLYTEQTYWTMSPYFADSMGWAYAFYVASNGSLNNTSVNSMYDYGVRPVINLSADVTLTGSGTATDPYIVS